MKSEQKEQLNETPETQAGSEAASATEALESRIKELEAAQEAQQDQYKRVLAEYDNFRKRSAKEKETIYADVTAQTVSEFLPVLDNLERGAAQENADEGVKLILKQFREILTKYHVESCAEEGQTFDPNFHNAVLHEEGEGSGETVIAQVLQKGYTMNGKLIRAAMVKTTD